MDERDGLAARFEESRAHLKSVAYRMLGSPSEADDAVQEAWLRLSRSDTSEVDNLRGWLTTVVARVCLDMLRSRKARREEPADDTSEPAVGREDAVHPESEALLADSVGLALLVVLDALAPAERLAFVLHDMFGVSFDEIAPIVERTPAATRQLASRARRRVQGAEATVDRDAARQREVVSAFMRASREGRFESLLALLDPDVALRADRAAAQTGAPADVRGAAAVANFFSGRAHAARAALIDGVAGAVWAPGGVPRVALVFTVEDGVIAAIDVIADPQGLGELDLVMVD